MAKDDYEIVEIIEIGQWFLRKRSESGGSWKTLGEFKSRKLAEKARDKDMEEDNGIA